MISPRSLANSVAADGFAVFARLWAVAGVFHFLSFHDWRWWSSYGPGTVTALKT